VVDDDEEPLIREPPSVRRKMAALARVEEYQQPLGSYLLHLTGDLTVALRLTQEAFVCTQHAEGDARSILAIRPWLFRVATRLAYRYLRQQRASSQPGRLGSERNSSGRVGSSDEERALVRSVLLDLRVGERAVLLLCDYEELPLGEVAAILGLSTDRLRQRLARARAHFRLIYVGHHAQDERALLPPR
jgi:RNA polymerase sigma factor (sigma-70 family)